MQTILRGEKVLYESNRGDDRAMRKKVSKLTEESSGCLYIQLLIPPSLEDQSSQTHQPSTTHINTAHCYPTFTTSIIFTKLFHRAPSPCLSPLTTKTSRPPSPSRPLVSLTTTTSKTTSPSRDRSQTLMSLDLSSSQAWVIHVAFP